MVDANVPGRIGCSFLGYTSPAPIQLPSNLITPEINVRPDGVGRLLLQVPDLDHLSDPKQVTPTNGLIGTEMMARLARVIRNTESVRLERIAIGQRARPADGLPAVGFATAHKRLYVVATHSEMTLAPVLGPVVAEELLDGVRSPLLYDFSPDRLISKTADDFKAIATIHFPTAQ